jgi:hypothetical protein
MQDEDHRLTPCRKPAPADQPNEQESAGSSQQDARENGIRNGNPGSDAARGCNQSRPVDPVEARRELRMPLPCKPIAGEARRDPVSGSAVSEARL